MEVRYPINASAINKTNINIPNNHSSSLGFLYDPYINALNMCKYMTIKKNEAPVECIYLINQPHSTSLMMYSTDANADAASGL